MVLTHLSLEKTLIDVVERKFSFQHYCLESICLHRILLQCEINFLGLSELLPGFSVCLEVHAYILKTLHLLVLHLSF